MYEDFNTSNVKVYHSMQVAEMFVDNNFNTSNVKVYPTHLRAFHASHPVLSLVIPTFLTFFPAYHPHPFFSFHILTNSLFFQAFRHFFAFARLVKFFYFQLISLNFLLYPLLHFPEFLLQIHYRSLA